MFALAVRYLTGRAVAGGCRVASPPRSYVYGTRGCVGTPGPERA
jgi:hypothetical protein